MDIISKIFSALVEDVRADLEIGVSPISILIALTVAVIVVAILPWFITVPVVVLGWGALLKGIYDEEILREEVDSSNEK